MPSSTVDRSIVLTKVWRVHDHGGVVDGWCRDAGKAHFGSCCCNQPGWQNKASASLKWTGRWAIRQSRPRDATRSKVSGGPCSIKTGHYGASGVSLRCRRFLRRNHSSVDGNVLSREEGRPAIFRESSLESGHRTLSRFRPDPDLSRPPRTGRRPFQGDGLRARHFSKGAFNNNLLTNGVADGVQS